MSEILDAAAARIGAPASMVDRSARARAKAEGVAPEVVLARWAGVEAPAAAAAAPAAAPAPAAAAPTPAATAPPAPVGDAGVSVEVLKPDEPSGEPEPAPEPAPEAAGTVEEEPLEELVVASAGIKETIRSGFPRWMRVAFIVVPLLAAWYAVAYATGPACGNAGALAVDPVTGNAVNCDGTPFGGGGSPLVLGSKLYTVEALPACQSCHGAGGGGGAGPALSGGSVLVTFPDCADHQEWIHLGTSGWREARGDTYGATNKPVGGGGNMPGFAALTPEEIRAVAIYERVQFGGEPLADAEAACVVPEEGATTAAAP